jgi:UDP-N-acetyl-D-mannosaminuronic acid transferase (WecB/TagA/CpsF family)
LKKDILGLNIDDVTMEEALQIALSFTESDSAKTVYTPNAEIAMAALRDSEFLEILNRGDLVIPDGAGDVFVNNKDVTSMFRSEIPYLRRSTSLRYAMIFCKS